MSSFDNPQFQWRETFFLFHRPEKQPTVKSVERTLKQVNPRFEIREINGDADGKFASLTLIAPDAYSAIDMSYAEADELAEQIETLQKELTATDAEDREKVGRIRPTDMRLDLLHFEQIVVGEDDDDDEMDAYFDPGALILVINALAKLCDGVGVDPGSATVV